MAPAFAVTDTFEVAADSGLEEVLFVLYTDQSYQAPAVEIGASPENPLGLAHCDPLNLPER